MYRGGTLAFLVMVSAACATTPKALPEPPLPPGQMVEVQPGQTVWELSQMYGISVEEIVEVNGLENAHEVAAGQILFVPAGGLPRPIAPEPTSTPAPAPAPPVPTASAAGLVWPVDGVVLRDFAAGGSKKPAYEGILIAAPAHTVVRSASAGVVAFAGNQGTNLGAMVIVDHGTGLMTIYGHLGRLGVKEGELIARGAALGEVGTSGLLGASPRLYFQVRRDKEPVDPLPLLPD